DASRGRRIPQGVSLRTSPTWRRRAAASVALRPDRQRADVGGIESAETAPSCGKLRRGIVGYGIVEVMAARFPIQVQLLHPTLVQPFDRPRWVYEEKVDGWRMVAYKRGAAVRLVSRRGLDHTARFAALAKSIAALPSADLILDGEVAV